MDYEIVYTKSDSCSLKIDGKLFNYNGIEEFEWIQSCDYIGIGDSYIQVSLYNGNTILVKPDGMVFEYNNMTEFDWIYRFPDGSIGIGIDSEYFLIEPDGTLFEYDGVTEFASIYRYSNGRTEFTVRMIVEAGEK